MSKAQPVSKPFAGFDDFDGCVRENQDKEDPEAFCAWLEDHAKDALSDPNAETVLTGLTTEFVSSVDRPAQDSEWLLFKDADTPRRKAAEAERPYVFPTDGAPCGSCVKGEDPCEDGWVMVGTKPNPNGSGEVPDCVPEDDVDDPPNIESELAGLPDDFDADEWRNRSKAADVDVREENDDGERQIAYAAVLIPNDVDKQGDVIPPYVVERAAHEYMAEYRKMDSDHDLEDGAGVPVESWILKEEQEFDLPDGGTVTYPEGTWVIGKRFVDDEWERVKAGELSGFSIYGGANAVDVGELKAELSATAKGVDATGSERNSDMKNALQAAYKSDTPTATLADRVQDGVSKAEIPDEDAAMVVDVLRDTASMLEESMGDGGGDEPPEPEADENDGDDEDDVEESTKDQPDDTNENMTNDDTPDDGGTNDGGSNDGADGGDDVADGIDELKSMVKGVDEKVDDFDDRLTDVEDEVDALKSAVGDDVPNDRIDDGDVDDDVPENERMKSVAKEAANEAVAAVAGVDDADDPEVVRKGLREQVGAGDAESGVDADLPDEDYSGVVDDANDTGVSKSEGTGVEGNVRLSGGGS